MITKGYQLSRRNFIKHTGIAGLGLIVGLDAHARAYNLAGKKAETLNVELSPFILIDADNNITIINPRPDMGQGTRQSVPSLIAEELEVSFDQIHIIQSDGKSKYGSQTAGGSSSISTLWIPLRKAGAGVREMLIQAAANRWKVHTSQCNAASARVHLKGSDESFTYGQLVEDASKLEIPQDPPLKDAKDFKILGKHFPKRDTPARVTGKAVYGIDIEVPGMVYASVLHSPMLFGKVVSIDDEATRKVAGVQQVMKCERKMIHRMAEGVAVIASSWWAANKGREALKVTWDNADLEKSLHTDEYFKRCYEASKKEGIVYEQSGSFETKFASAEKKLEATFETPFLAHVPVEPENATV